MVFEMIAVARHIMLLLLLRHDLEGLPRNSTVLVGLVFAASALVAGLRWGNLAFIPGHLIVLCIMAYHLSPRFATAYALLSIGIDVIALPVEVITGERGGFFPFGAWELAGIWSIFVMERHHLKSTHRRP